MELLFVFNHSFKILVVNVTIRKNYELVVFDRSERQKSRYF